MGLIRRLFGLKALEPGWRDYEIAAALYLKVLGFRNVEVGKGSSDGGVDVRVPGRLVGQVKAHQAKVGRPPLQQIAGVAGAEEVNAVFFSRAGYTKTAEEWASTGGVGLFTISFDDDHFDVLAVNRLGDRLRP
jgi:HJR/Mrr/RecB family endonuclease